jgi:uncharacterized membrane protein YfcA
MWDDPAVAGLLTWPTLSLVWLGAFLGALAVGGAGFAFALVASAIWLHVLDPVHTTLLVVACGIVLHTGLVWQMRRSIEPGRLWPFVAAGVAGIPLGVWLLAHTNAGALKMAIGIFLACYGLYALLAPRLPRIAGGGRTADGTIGFVAGILGGLGGYSGVLPTIWTQLRGWPRETARAVYQPFILVAQITTLIIVGFVAADVAGLLLLVATLPALLAGAWLGWRIYGRLDERRFRQVLAALLIVSGAALWV